jgi:uncharacterized coiled-coil DUF342 family protein
MTSKKFFALAILGAVLALPVLQANAAAGPATDVTNSMQQAKQAAFTLSETADRLHAITRNGGHSWQSHSWYLDSAREDVNRLGKMLQELEDMKPIASETQQMGIARMRPHLVETANGLTNAIDLLNDRRHNVYFPEYRERIETVSEQATSLHQSLDAVLKYEGAKARLDSLELLPTSESGS